MTPYFVMYGILWGIAIISTRYGKRTNNNLFIVQGALLVLFTALKFETGFDWPVYKHEYENESLITFEPGYRLLTLLFQIGGLDFHTFWAILGALITLGILYVVKHTSYENKTITIAILFAMPDLFIIPAFSLVRHSISILLLLFAILQWRRGNIKMAAAFLILAPFFHIGVVMFALFCLGVYLILRRNSVILMLFIFGAILYIASIDIFGFLINWIISQFIPIFLIYLERDTFDPRFEYKVVFVLVTALLFFLIHFSAGWTSKRDTQEISIVKAIAYSGLLAPLFFFGYPTFHSRLLFLAGFFIAALSINSLTRLTKINKTTIVSIAGLVMLLPLYRFLSSPLSTPFVPYQSILHFDESNSTGIERTEELLDLLHSFW